MTTTPDSPLNLPLLTDPQVPDTLTLISLIREEISQAVSPLLTRADEKAFVLVSAVANGVVFFALALSKSGEYRELEIELNLMQMWHLKEQQYLEQNKNHYKGEHQQTKENKGSWFSMLFTIENDGFISKTTYNYDKPVFVGANPEEWLTIPETSTPERASLWSAEQYLEDLEKFPRETGKLDWLG
jgi:C1A family cysteine protease